MPRVFTNPPPGGLRPDGNLVGGWWHDDPDSGRIVCDLCPRACSLKRGDRGFCFVRQNVDDQLVLTTFGRSTGFCIDPIEKKPLNQFYPGTSVLSFGTAGCNLGCKFCQNWDISKSREVARLSELATPEAIAEAARASDCRSVAFTYNDPVIWAEYAIATARACRALGIKAVAVTAGYITPAARGPFFEVMDAANVDLKGFTEEFYHKITYSHLQPVLDTLGWLKRETDVWFEITNLLIPRANDDPGDLRRMCDWIIGHVGVEVPVHFTAFHPDFRMNDRPRTPIETLLKAHEIARASGLKYVYTGNVNDVQHQSTYCPHCGRRVIERDWYALGRYDLIGDRCGRCGGAVAGRFDERPGTWGRKRQPLEIARFAPPGQVIESIQPLAKPRPAMSTAPMPLVVEDRPGLSDDQKGAVLRAATEFVAADVGGRPPRLDDPDLAGAADFAVIGAYVTLRRQGHLRACCGLVGEPRRLIDALRISAGRTATEDHRLPPIAAEELEYFDIDVNLLHGLAPVTARGRDRIAAVEVGRHGLRIQRGEAGGLLLPSVPVEHGWDSEAFLRHVCRKAGLPTTAWDDDESRLFTFESIEFGGPFAAGAGAGEATTALLSAEELQRLAAHARENIFAVARGLTPNYYVFGIADGTVTGVVLTVETPGLLAPQHQAQLSIRPGLPLQATLFGLCESAARTLPRSAAASGSIRVGLTVLHRPAIHGTAGKPDHRGLDPARRALVLLENGKTACVFDPSMTPEGLVDAVREEVRALNPEGAALISLAAQSTEPRMSFSTVPRPVAVGGIRRPAVAGRFYPAGSAELSEMVSGMLAQSDRRSEPWPAVMVPHAGLTYSGSLAAAVFNRVAIPGLLLVLGPKHTRFGVEWAIMPHDAWSVPGATVASDPALARKLADAVPGLQLDAAAHQHEHAIEVELPFLSTLAPTARVLGLAVGGGNWESCRRFATGLADFLRALPEPPLLVISSDMNHFANDAENRRLDAIALEAMERLDPAHLLATVREHDISMCGVLPAVIVMETLKQLGSLSRSERVGYATSADVAGDPSRVVGYAGMLLG